MAEISSRQGVSALKLKCKDGVVRNFQVSRYCECECLECGHLFGVHDTKFAKPMFREHVCNCEILIRLPLPDRLLHPNARCHWAQKARKTKEARYEAGVESIAAWSRLCRRVRFKAAEVTLTYYVKRLRDEDGLIAWAKSYLDGVQDGIKLDDKYFRLQRPHQVKSSSEGLLITIVEAK